MTVDAGTDFKTPRAPSLVGAAVEVAVGNDYSLARLKDGRLFAWG
jgi:alpha-tubulin suppressor-like RCC1 family protein